MSIITIEKKDCNKTIGRAQYKFIIWVMENSIVNAIVVYANSEQEALEAIGG